jgi:LPXTG-motif cell wall-anchored protein
VGVLNKRNAVLGWLVWQGGKRFAKRKAKSAVPAIGGEAKRPNRSAVLLAGLAAVGGALLFWRKRGKDESEPIG